MYVLDHMVVVIKPRVEFVRWIAHKPIEDNSLSIKEQRNDCISILTPLMENEKKVFDYIDSIYMSILTRELQTRVNEKFWPREINCDLFHQWFEIEVHSRVYMTCENLFLHDSLTH